MLFTVLKMTIKVIPKKIDSIYNILYNQLNWSFALWNELKYLFSEKIRMDLINHCAPTYFYNVQQTILIEIQLVICRLTDPFKSGKNKNVSFHTLKDSVRSLEQIELAEKIEDELKKANTAILAIRNRRNKLLAHIDFKSAISNKVTPIPELTEKQIDNSLFSFSNSLNFVSSHFLGNVTAFEQIVVKNGIAGLLYYLQDGTRYRELKNDGKISLNDLIKGKYYGV